MATNKKNKIKSKKLNKNIAKMLILIIVVGFIIYGAFKIIELIIDPTEIVMIENGTIYKEESAIRLYNKR